MYSCSSTLYVSCVHVSDQHQNKYSGEGWWRIFLSVIDVGKISCTGCILNRKKPFKIACLNQIPVLRFFFPSSVHTYLQA
jgi:hypothetical protein